MATFNVRGHDTIFMLYDGVCCDKIQLSSPGSHAVVCIYTIEMGTTFKDSTVDVDDYNFHNNWASITLFMGILCSSSYEGKLLF